MANVTNFMTEGAEIPAGSAFKSMTTQTAMPDWYTNYAMQLLSNQQAQMATPYQTYQGPRVAEFSPTQQQAFGATAQAAGAYQPALGAATSATQGLMGQNALSGAQPYFSQAAGMSPSAAAQPFLNQGQQLTQQSTQALGMQAAEPSFRAAEALNSVKAAQPMYQQAQGLIGQGTATSGLEAAQPLISQAAQRATNVSDYMNPYIEQVVNRAGELGARTLREQLLPEIEGRYIRAGQLGFGPRGGEPSTPSGMMTETARALRDVQGNVLAQQAQLMSQGYTQAQGVSQTDLARQAQLAATTGQLGTAQQQALLEAAGQQAAMGTQLGQLTQAQQQALANIGAQRGQLGTAQQQALAQAGQQMGALGQIGGSLTAQQQQNLANIGSQIGSIGGADLSRQLSAAGQLGDLGAQAQTLGLAGAGALANVGAQQQAQAQKNLDVAYADHLRQQGYNQEQINAALATFQGVQGGIPKAVSEVGITPTGQYQPSTLSSIGGALAAGAGILDKLKVI